MQKSTVIDELRGVLGTLKDIKVGALKMLGIDSERRNFLQRVKSNMVYFPIISSDSISFETSNAIKNYTELSMASMMITYFSTESIDIKNDMDNHKTNLAALVKDKIVGKTQPLSDLALVTNPKDIGFNEAMLIDLKESMSQEFSYIFTEARKKKEPEPEPEPEGDEEEEDDDETPDVKVKLKLNVIQGSSEDNSKGNDPKTALGKRQYTQTKAISALESLGKTKKLNDADPMFFTLPITTRKDDGALDSYAIVIGVKGFMHPIASTDIIENLPKAFVDGSFLVRLIKFVTGEISFFKDFLFEVDRVKKDIAEKKLKAFNFQQFITAAKVAKSSFFQDVPLPTSSLIITKDEVDEMKRLYKVDLMSAASANALLKNVFLMQLMVVDESIGVIYIYDQTEHKFQKHPIDDIRRKADKEASDLKEIIKSIKTR